MAKSPKVSVLEKQSPGRNGRNVIKREATVPANHSETKKKRNKNEANARSVEEAVLAPATSSHGDDAELLQGESPRRDLNAAIKNDPREDAGTTEAREEMLAQIAEATHTVGVEACNKSGVLLNADAGRRSSRSSPRRLSCHDGDATSSEETSRTATKACAHSGRSRGGAGRRGMGRNAKDNDETKESAATAVGNRKSKAKEDEGGKEGKKRRSGSSADDQKLKALKRAGLTKSDARMASMQPPGLTSLDLLLLFCENDRLIR